MENPQNNGTGSAIMNRINQFRSEHTKAFVAIVIVLALLCLGGCSSVFGEESNTGSADQQATQTAGIFSFIVESDQWNKEADGDIVVAVTGEADDGSAVLEQFNVVPGEECQTSLGAGKYEIALVDGKATQSNNYFVAPVVSATFDGKQNKNAVLQMKLDTEKMKQLEEEAAAKKAAEEKAAAEKAAAEKAAAEKQAQAKKESAAQSSSSKSSSASNNDAPSTRTVYVASSGKGKKYHNDPSCSKMKGSTALSLGEAQSRGYSPCSKCC